MNKKVYIILAVVAVCIFIFTVPIIKMGAVTCPKGPASGEEIIVVYRYTIFEAYQIPHPWNYWDFRKISMVNVCV